MGIAIFIPIIYVFFLAIGLRAATWIFNRVFAHKGTANAGPSEETWSVAADRELEYESTEAGPYTAPTAHFHVDSVAIGRPIPEPSIVKGVGIGCVTVFGMFLLNAVLFSVITSSPGPTNLKGTIVMTLFFGIGFLFHAGLLSRTLPTTYLRSLGVTLIVLLLFASLALGLAVPFWLIGTG